MPVLPTMGHRSGSRVSVPSGKTATTSPSPIAVMAAVSDSPADEELR